MERTKASLYVDVQLFTPTLDALVRYLRAQNHPELGYEQLADQLEEDWMELCSILEEQL